MQYIFYLHQRHIKLYILRNIGLNNRKFLLIRTPQSSIDDLTAANEADYEGECGSSKME